MRTEHYIFHALESRVQFVHGKGISLSQPRWLATERSKKVTLIQLLLYAIWSRRFMLYFVLPSLLFTIMKTSSSNVYPLTPHFYIVKLGFTGVYIIFLFLLQNIDRGYSLEPPH